MSTYPAYDANILTKSPYRSPAREVGSYVTSGAYTTSTVPVTTSSTKDYTYSTGVTRSPWRSPARVYNNEPGVTYTTISDATIDAKPRQFETTNVSSHVVHDPKYTTTVISDETLNARPREHEGRVISEGLSTFEGKVTFTTISDNTNVKPREFVTEAVVSKPVVADCSACERRCRELEHEIQLLKTRPLPQPEIREVERIVEVPVERVVERVVEVPVDRVVEKRIEVPVERVVEVPVERVVEVPVEKVVEVEKIVEVPVEKIVEVERIVEVPPKPVERDLSGCNPFVGFGLVESEKTKGRGFLPVETVWENGPAYDAGLRLDDEIHQIGQTGQPIQSLNQVQNIIRSEARIGQPLRVSGVSRQTGKPYETQIIPGTTAPKAAQWNDIYYNTKANRKLGHSVKQ